MTLVRLIDYSQHTPVLGVEIGAFVDDMLSVKGFSSYIMWYNSPWKWAFQMGLE